MKIYERDIKKTFLQYNSMFKTVLISGPRQIGKTTFLLSIKENEREYVSLDDWDTREEAINNPKMFLEKHKPPLIIDEIQYAPKLMSYIKIVCDKSNKKGLYWLTGSQKIELMKNVSESLAGRLGVIEMQSFSYREINKLKYEPIDLNNLSIKKNMNKDEIIKTILDGGMPGYLFEKIDRDFFFSSYVNLYLERDIRELKQITDLIAFKSFLVSVASRAGQLLNYSSIARDIKKDDKTVKSWISVLETTGIIKLIYPLRKEELKKVISTPKIIFMDSGLCTYLIRKNTIDSLKRYTNFGFIFENYIISELIKMNENCALKYSFSYFRDKNKNEIDIVIEDYEGIIHPYEVKLTDKVDISMISSFKLLNDSYDVGVGGIICTSEGIESLTNKNQIIPISSILC